MVIWNNKTVSCCKKIVNFSPFYLWIIRSHTLQATQFSMWMTGTYIQIKEVIAPPWKIYSKTFFGNYRLSHPSLWNGDPIHVLLKKIMHHNMQEIVRKLNFGNMHYAQVLKKLILSASFSMLPILINVSKLFFLHNIAPRMNGILENLHLENSINLCIWEKKHKLVLIFSCVDWNNANELSLSYPKQHKI